MDAYSVRASEIKGLSPEAKKSLSAWDARVRALRAGDAMPKPSHSVGQVELDLAPARERLPLPRVLTMPVSAERCLQRAEELRAMTQRRWETDSIDRRHADAEREESDARGFILEAWSKEGWQHARPERTVIRYAGGEMIVTAEAAPGLVRALTRGKPAPTADAPPARKRVARAAPVPVPPVETPPAAPVETHRASEAEAVASLFRPGGTVTPGETVPGPAAVAPPKSSPWGAVEHARAIAPGIWSVSTAGHGGIKLDAARNAKVDAAWRRKGGWYEEDCDYSIAILAHPEAFTAAQVESARIVAARWHAGLVSTPAAPEPAPLAVSPVPAAPVAAEPVPVSPAAPVPSVPSVPPARVYRSRPVPARARRVPTVPAAPVAVAPEPVPAAPEPEPLEPEPVLLTVIRAPSAPPVAPVTDYAPAVDAARAYLAALLAA